MRAIITLLLCIFLSNIVHAQDAYRFMGMSKEEVVDIVGYDYKEMKTQKFGTLLMYTKPKETKYGLQLFTTGYYFINNKCWRISYIQPLSEYQNWKMYLEDKFIKVAGNRYIKSRNDAVFWDLSVDEKLVTVTVYSPVQ
ncbi:hypothetical protein JYG30_04025 [Fibrella sp. USSR17]